MDGAQTTWWGRGEGGEEHIENEGMVLCLLFCNQFFVVVFFVETLTEKEFCTTERSEKDALVKTIF